MNSELLDKVLATPRLPSLPAVAMRVIDLTDQPDVSIKELAKVIQNDQGLATKVLKTVNSSFYGLTKKCSTINQAMVALGMNAVKTLALGFSLVHMINENKAEEFDYLDYWRRGLFSGVGARTVAAATRCCDPEEVFLAGILQDVGMIALFQALGREYLAIIREAAGDHRALIKHEVRRLELTHADIGAMLAQRWKFPDSLVAPIKYHERPTAAPLDHTSAARCLAIGNIAADILAEQSPTENLRRYHERCSQWLNVSPDAAEKMLSRIHEGARELASLLRVDIGKPPMPEEILSRASERLVEISIEQEQEAERLAERNAELQREAVTDPLTGVANRRRFNAESLERFNAAKAAGKPLSVVLFDADRFKSVNDSLGHQAGDVVLVTLAARLQKHYEPIGGLVCRYGGEEFAVIIPGQPRADAARLTDAFRADQAARPIDISAAVPDAEPLAVTVSAGVAGLDAQCADVFPTIEHLIRAADQAVYAAKGSGRNCVRVFNPRPKAPAANPKAA